MCQCIIKFEKRSENKHCLCTKLINYETDDFFCFCLEIFAYITDLFIKSIEKKYLNRNDEMYFNLVSVETVQL